MPQPQRNPWIHRGLALLLLLLVLGTVIWPLVDLFGQTLGPPADTRAVLLALLQDPLLQESALRTLGVALLACVLASVFALPAAFAAVRGPRLLRLPTLLIGVLPLLIPPFVSASLLQDWLTTAGGPPTGLVAGLEIRRPTLLLALVFAVHHLPLMILSLAAGLARIDRGYAESARNLGAGRVYTLRHITLPLLTPPFLLGAALLMLRVIEDVGTPLLLGSERMLAPQLLLRLGNGPADQGPAGVALLMLLISTLIVVIAWQSLAPDNRGRATGLPPRPARWAGATGRWFAALIAAGALATVSLAPFLLLCPDSCIPLPAGSAGLIDSPRLPAQLLLAGASGLLLVLLGSLAMALLRSRGAPALVARLLLGGLFAVPGAVLALAIGRLLPAPAGSMPPIAGGLALALLIALKTLPYLPHLLAHWRRAYTEAHRELARTLGAGRTRTLLRVVLPLPLTLLLAVLLLGVAAGLNEWSAALLLLQHGDLTPAAEIFSQLRLADDAAVVTARILMLLALTAVSLLPSLWLFGYGARRSSTRPPARGHDHRGNP
jgi:iron(III) transport system permease protein